MSGLHAGAASRIITPPVGVDLCGFAARAGPSVGVHDDLQAKALYLSANGRSLLLLTADLIGLSHEQAMKIRERIADATGVPAEAVMITCSHTHSGPATPALTVLGEVDQNYIAGLEEKLVSAASEACTTARPATLGWRREEVCIHVNRRQVTEHGVVIGHRPGGLTLPWVDVLAVDDAEGRPLARWFCHACHAVVLGGDNLLITADWPGYAQRTVEAAEPGCVALFAQGCCGDLNPSPRGSFAIAERHGKAVAGAVIKAAALADRTAEPPVAFSAELLRLPLQDPPPLEEAERLAAQIEADYRAREADMLYAERKWYGGWVRWARELVELARQGATGGAIPYLVQVFRIGDGAIVGLPGEVFAQYAANLNADSPAAVTAVAAYTNGYCSYVPTEAAFAEGGYEVEIAFRGTLPTMLAPTCEHLILAAARRQITALF